MLAVVQRVLRAEVSADGVVAGRIGRGILAYLSVGKDDCEKDGEFIADKLVNLRIFEDTAGKMNLSVKDVDGQVLVVSNFTLHGDCSKGRRPGFDAAAGPEAAEQLYEKVISLAAGRGIKVEKGVFGAHMHIESINDGPVTFIIDSSRKVKR